MEGLTPIVDALSKGWTPGGVGIWVIVLTMLTGLWKGLPAVLDAWSNSVARERENREKEVAAERGHREREISRLESQIAASDKRHEECMEGQKALRAEIAEQNKTISALVLGIRQMQLSGSVGVTEFPASMASIINRIGGVS